MSDVAPLPPEPSLPPSAGNGRVPPHHADAEAAALAAMLTDPTACAELAAHLSPEHFYLSSHRTIFEAAVSLLDGGTVPDLVTTAARLREQGTLEMVGGTVALAAITQQVQTTSSAVAYARLIRRAYAQRRLIQFGAQAGEAGFGSSDVGTEVDTLLNELVDLAGLDDTARSTVGLRDAVADAMRQVEEIHQSDGQLLGVPTGLPALDEVTRGLRRQHLYLLAARPGIGKSVVALNWAVAAARAGHSVLLLSLEMSSHELALRMLSAASGVDQERLASGKLNDQDWASLTDACAELAALPIVIDDTAEMTVAKARAAADRQRRSPAGLDLLIIDYVQLMEHHDRDLRGRQEKVAAISRGLKVTAKDLDVPVLALAQLSRKVEERPNKRPQLSDLRDSGGLEQDADLVVGGYRDEMYDPTSPDRGVIELILLKHRHGPTMIVKAAFLGHIARVAPLYRSEQPTPPAQPQSPF